MGTWGDILKEVQESARQNAPHGRGPSFDDIRDKYIRQLHEHTGNAVIVYASGWYKGQGGDLDFSVHSADVHALMEVCYGVDERELDLILHSPGGQPQAAEQMVDYLRTRFDYIRAIVPLEAKSAASMIALGCDEIVLGSHSQLGPIDPQIVIPTPEGRRQAPAHAILKDFQRAKEDIGGDVSQLPAWTPILRSYGGGLIDFCHQQIELSQDVVAGWLEKYMLSHEDVDIGDADLAGKARRIAEYFGSDESYERFRTHSRPIRIEELQTIRGLRVNALEDDDDLQDAVLSIYHALDLTFGGPAIKIVENHNGRRMVRLQQPQVIQVPGPAGPQPGQPQQADPGVQPQQQGDPAQDPQEDQNQPQPGRQDPGRGG